MQDVFGILVYNYQTMNPRNFSLLIAGFLWIAVGLRIGKRGLGWLEPYFQTPDWHLYLLGLSLIIGLAKAFTVLRKAVNRRIETLAEIDDQPLNYLVGWLKLLGPRGIIVIGIMIGLGFGLRFWRESGGDPYNIFGFIYLGIAIGLIGSSAFFFKAINKDN
ncbi:MAG: hypothetical protein HOA17_04005 [Candidatus Melainabacteria bacterium]|nr:hypothetical protein [Candidatus Melainabacteria bacterium]